MIGGRCRDRQSPGRRLGRSSSGSASDPEGFQERGILGPVQTTVSHLDRITVDPAVCHGKPIIRGMRWPVQTVLELLASDMTFEQVLADHPELERDDLLASLEFAAAQAAGQYVVPLIR